MNSYLNSRIVFGAAIVGLVGAASVYIYDQIKSANRRALLVKEMAFLRRQVNIMKNDMEALREIHIEHQMRQDTRRRRINERREERQKRLAAAGDGIDAAGDPNASFISQDFDAGNMTDQDYHTVIDTDTETEDFFYDVNTDEDNASVCSDETYVPSSATDVLTASPQDNSNSTNSKEKS